MRTLTTILKLYKNNEYHLLSDDERVKLIDHLTGEKND